MEISQCPSIILTRTGIGIHVNEKLNRNGRGIVGSLKIPETKHFRHPYQVKKVQKSRRRRKVELQRAAVIKMSQI